MSTQPQTAEAPDPAKPSAVVPVQPRPIVEFDPDDPVALYMNTAVFEQLQRVAKLMCSSGLVPAHLRGAERQADCFLVAAQAFRWRTDPFAVAQCSFVLSGKLGYEGKLVAAIVNSHKDIDPEHRLDYVYGGEGQDRKVIVSARLRGEVKDRTVDGTVKQWATQNDKWKSMADQMLAYRGAREWARRHMPQAMLGIQADEEVVETIDLEQRDGAFVARASSLDDLTEKLRAEATPPATAEKSAETCGPQCAGCDKNEPPPDAQDDEGRAYHKACLEVLQKEKAAAAQPKTSKPSRERQGRFSE